MFGLPSTTLIPAALIFLAVAFGTLSLALLVDILQERSRRRDAMRQLRSFTNNVQSDGPGLLRGLGTDVPDWLVPVVSRVPALEDARLMLEQAGSKMSLARFLVDLAGTLGGPGTRRPRSHAQLDRLVSRRRRSAPHCPTWCFDTSAPSGSTSSRSCCPRPSTCSGGPSARATRCRPGSRWWPTKPASRWPASSAGPTRSIASGSRSRTPCWRWRTGSRSWMSVSSSRPS